MRGGREGCKMFVPFDPVIPLGNSTPRNVFNKRNKAVCAKMFVATLFKIGRKPNGSAKEGELENYFTST